jgi:hypothetical protein
VLFMFHVVSAGSFSTPSVYFYWRSQKGFLSSQLIVCSALIWAYHFVYIIHQNYYTNFASSFFITRQVW